MRNIDAKESKYRRLRLRKEQLVESIADLASRLSKEELEDQVFSQRVQYIEDCYEKISRGLNGLEKKMGQATGELEFSINA